MWMPSQLKNVLNSIKCKSKLLSGLHEIPSCLWKLLADATFFHSIVSSLGLVKITKIKMYRSLKSGWRKKYQSVFRIEYCPNIFQDVSHTFILPLLPSYMWFFFHEVTMCIVWRRVSNEWALIWNTGEKNCLLLYRRHLCREEERSWHILLCMKTKRVKLLLLVYDIT